MKKLRYTLLAAVCMLAAVAAIGATTASAALFVLTTTPCTGGEHLNLCYETASKEKLELEGEQSAWAVSEEGEPLFEVNGGATLQLLSLKAEAESITLIQLHPLSENGTATSTGFDFTGNSIEGPAEIAEKCKLTLGDEELILTVELKGSLTGETLLKVETKAGGAFVEITLENAAGKTCPMLVVGPHAVTGFQNFLILEAGVATATKLGEPEELNLKFVGLASGFEGTPEVELKFETHEKTEKLEDNVYVSTVA